MTMNFSSRFILTLFLLSFSLPGFAADRTSVFVSIVPQKFFVQQIGKDLVDVHVMVRPGASPAVYEPKPRQMADLSKAKVYFAIGVPFESTWLKKITAANSKMKVVHTDHGVEKIPMAVPHHHDEEGERKKEAEHHHGRDPESGIVDPHIWLSPPLVKIQAHAILAALRDIDPAHGAVYEANYHQFVSEIDDLDARLRALFEGRRGRKFMVFHPSWGYFARAYGLEQIPIEIEGKSPKPAQLKELIEHARENDVKIVFVQPQFSTKNAELVAREIGGQVAFADPLAEDWTANLLEVAEKFKAALEVND